MIFHLHSRRLILGFLFLVFSARLVAESERPYPISWEAVLGAGGYLVEVQTERQTLVSSRTVKENKITVNLYPGAYRFRLTTFNRFMRAEASTEWIVIRVLAPSPPTFVSTYPKSILTGEKRSLEVTTLNLSREGTASVTSPSGRPVPLVVESSSKTKMHIQLPALDEAGKYSLVLTNPPDLATTVDAAFSARYPDPVVTRLEPDEFANDQQPATLRVVGADFSPEVRVSLTVQGKEVNLLLVSHDPTDLVVSLPAGMEPGDYRLSVLNEPDAAPFAAPWLHVTKARPGQPSHKPAPTGSDRNLLVSADWTLAIPRSSWADIYGPNPKSGALGVDCFLARDRVPFAESFLSLGMRASLDLSELSTKPEESNVLVSSNLTTFPFVLAPFFELPVSFFHIRVYQGAGFAYTKVSGGDSSGNSQTRGSLDFVISTRLAVDIPVSDVLRIEVVGEYQHLFLTEPLDLFFLGSGLVFVVPLS